MEGDQIKRWRANFNFELMNCTKYSIKTKKAIIKPMVRTVIIFL